MGRGSKASALIFAPMRRPRRPDPARQLRLEQWIRVNRVDYLRALGHTHHERLTEELRERLTKRLQEASDRRVRVRMHELTVRSELAGQETIGGYYEVQELSMDGMWRHVGGVDDVVFEGDELLGEPWLGLVRPEIERLMS